jgi:hypothetical protein
LALLRYKEEAPQVACIFEKVDALKEVVWKQRSTPDEECVHRALVQLAAICTTFIKEREYRLVLSIFSTYMLTSLLKQLGMGNT